MPDNEEKVSMIVAIYKSEAFLPKLLETIINQTWRNLEIILVDDGSPDNSGKICDDYALKDERIVVIHKENGGACAARNEGLATASGEYIVIIDGDDWLELDFIEYLMNLIHMSNADMALTDNIFTTRNRKQTENDHFETWSAEDATAAILYPKMEVGPWNKIYKTKLLRDNNITFSRPWSGEGLYFASTAAQHSNCVGVGHKKIYNYRLNNENSGLTNYNVQMGLNAFDNIMYISDNLVIRTQKTEAAVRHHIWKNYGYLLFLIVATNSIKEYKDKFYDCKKNIRKLLPDVMRESDYDLITKIKLTLHALFPVYFARRTVKKQKKAFAKDRMR